ncbi:MAG: ATP-binding protein [Oscillospiraceae bacterium]|nr:ATP-binding protein [Oscillospiraceae bacterium]
MALTNVKIENHFLFEDGLTIDFCKGINVIIGENGTGKTTLMRCLCKLGLTSEIGLIRINEVGKGNYKQSWGSVDIDSDVHNFVFIPEKDMLSIAKGIPESFKYSNTDYTHYEIAIIEQARVHATASEKPLYSKICNIIGGEPKHNGESFFMKRKNIDNPIPFSAEASGFRKFGLLAMLVRNEQIRNGTVLFWDEPENSLNPKLVPKLIDILLELSKQGVQIFLATHDYIFAKYIEVKMSEQDDILFHAFYNTDNGVKVETQKKFIALENNSIIKQSIQLYKDEVRKVME